MSFDSGPLAIALAMLIGVLAQAGARHARLPGIVLLLALGVALGPDGAGWVLPQSLGTGLPDFVGFAVAIILFEGALTIRFAALRRRGLAIRRLVTVGAVVTGVLATGVAWLGMAWDWRMSALFGTLVMVTGPTVVNPLVRRLRLAPHLGDILVAEGIFVDAIGATIAVVTLEIVTAHSSRAAAGEALSIFARFGAGAVVGAAAGLLLVLALRIRGLVPNGLENVLALAVAVATFQISNAIVHESGLTAVIIAGLLLGNVPTRRLHHIAEFKEQLTDLLVATLFVLLAADVRMADVFALGWRGVGVVVALMVVVRPATVFASTWGTSLTRNEKLCLAWIAPRGIVAAAVASLFAAELAREGIAGGTEFRALVFVVIALTVTIQGLSAGLVAELLAVRLPPRRGGVILGANPLAMLLARAVASFGERVVLVEARAELCEAARAQGFEVVQGDGLSTPVLVQAGVEGSRWCAGMTPNEHVNLLFARAVDAELRGPMLAILLERHDRGVTPAMADAHDVAVLFAAEIAVAAWLTRLASEAVELQRWKFLGADATPAFVSMPLDACLPLAFERGGVASPVAAATTPQVGDQLVVAIAASGASAAEGWLRNAGWRRIDP